MYEPPKMVRRGGYAPPSRGSQPRVLLLNYRWDLDGGRAAIRKTRCVFLHYSRVCHSATPRDLRGTAGLEPARAEAQLFPLALFIAVSIYWRSIRVPPSEFQIDSLV